MAWRLARSLTVYIAQVNAMAPGRSKVSDGTIGDAAHQGTASDHNPRDFPGWGDDIVTAADITHDSAGGCDMNVIAEQLRASRDARIKYVIWNRRMFSSYATSTYPAWTWRPYSGTNPHDHHGHLSTVGDPRADGTHPWAINLAGKAGDMYEQYDRDRVNDTWGKATKLVDEVAAVKASVAELAARPPITLTDAQVAEFGDRIGAVLAARIEAAVERVLERARLVVDDAAGG